VTDIKQVLGVAFHLRSAAASCEGRARFHEQDNNPHDAAIWNALADLFYEQAEHGASEGPVGSAFIAAADALNHLDDDPTIPQAGQQ
jgi:hypothetical protein